MSWRLCVRHIRNIARQGAKPPRRGGPLPDPMTPVALPPSASPCHRVIASPQGPALAAGRQRALWEGLCGCNPLRHAAGCSRLGRGTCDLQNRVVRMIALIMNETRRLPVLSGQIGRVAHRTGAASDELRPPFRATVYPPPSPLSRVSARAFSGPSLGLPASPAFPSLPRSAFNHRNSCVLRPESDVELPASRPAQERFWGKGNAMTRHEEHESHEGGQQ